MLLTRINPLESILLTKTTAAQTEDAPSYYRMRGLYFLAVVFVRSICWERHREFLYIYYGSYYAVTVSSWVKPKYSLPDKTLTLRILVDDVYNPYYL